MFILYFDTHLHTSNIVRYTTKNKNLPGLWNHVNIIVLSLPQAIRWNISIFPFVTLSKRNYIELIHCATAINRPKKRI